MMSRLPSRVLVMPEYGIDLLPLWARGPDIYGALHEDEMGISDQLASRLREWNTSWAAHPPQEPRRWSSQDEYQWQQTGYRLARQLQSELPDIQVWIMDHRGREVPLMQAS